MSDPSILMVDPTLSEAYFAASHLLAAGFNLTVSRSFQEAKGLLGSGQFALLISVLRLGAYNGLHLALRASAQSSIPAIVTSPTEDPVLRADAEALDVTYIVVPTSPREVVAAALRTLARARASDPVRPPFERRVMERRHDAALVAAIAERRHAERRRPQPETRPEAAQLIDPMHSGLGW